MYMSHVAYNSQLADSGMAISDLARAEEIKKIRKEMPFYQATQDSRTHMAIMADIIGLTGTSKEVLALSLDLDHLARTKPQAIPTPGEQLEGLVTDILFKNETLVYDLMTTARTIADYQGDTKDAIRYAMEHCSQNMQPVLNKYLSIQERREQERTRAEVLLKYGKTLSPSTHTIQ